MTDKIGVLVIAHGGSSKWNDMVRDAIRQASLDVPTEVVFGMGMHEHEVRPMQQAVRRLQRRRIDRLVVVPLLVSSHSEVFRQYEYLFGVRQEPEWAEAGKPLDLEVSVVMGRALDDNLVVAEILLERARALSRIPKDETVILVAHGPNSDADNAQWLERLTRLGESVRSEGGFRSVRSLTLRDDASPDVQGRAIQALRAAVESSSRQGRVLVVPVLIAQGGIERKIPKHLAGLSYVYSGETLLPHPKLVRWIANQAETLAGNAQRETALAPSSTLGSTTEDPVVPERYL